MPIYEYACTSCGERTEAKQSFDDPPLEDCPHCGGKLRKLFSPVGIVFKGSGFYSTDAKGSSKSSSTGDKTDTSSKTTESSGSAKTESKPAEKKKEGTATEKSA
ncbi:MAG TPA: zinc ribbon domain-containing protein [Actinomycetota bacterium]|nr:zinc ribbon domain-containing protein [Actinomycetota bacterium]